MDSYTVKQTSELTGISRPALRIYTRRYSRWLSPEATPPPGKARVFTPDDLRLLHFVYTYTGSGQTHEQVEDRLRAGELDAHPWHVPAEDAESEATEQTGVMAPDQARLLSVLFDEYRQREQAAVQREQELRDRLEQLQNQLGELRGRLAERGKWQPPPWWKYFFGSRRGE